MYDASALWRAITFGGKHRHKSHYFTLLVVNQVGSSCLTPRRLRSLSCVYAYISAVLQDLNDSYQGAVVSTVVRTGDVVSRLQVIGNDGDDCSGD